MTRASGREGEECGGIQRNTGPLDRCLGDKPRWYSASRHTRVSASTAKSLCHRMRPSRVKLAARPVRERWGEMGGEMGRHVKLAAAPFRKRREAALRADLRARPLRIN